MSSVRLSNIGDDVVELLIDMPGKSANVLTEAVLGDLDFAITELEKAQPRGIVIRSAKPTIFVAGADLVAISKTLDWPDERIIEFCQNGQRLFRRISQLNGFSVAAIHGVCVGGGMELTLWCDARIVTNSKRSLMGLPEVKLGLIPGWGGTARLPRLIGLEPAIEWVTSADLIPPAVALEQGIVKQIVEEDGLIDAALSLIDHAHGVADYTDKRKSLQQSCELSGVDLENLRESFQKRIDDNTAIYPFAPNVVLEHMLSSATAELQDACLSEARAMTRVYGSAENRGLLNTFFLEERCKKVRGDFGETMPLEIQTIGIVGAGLMGKQIATALAKSKINVGLFDLDRERSRKVCEELSASFADRVFVADNLDGLSGCQLVIESATEKLDVKRKLLSDLESVMDGNAILGTNTSAIPLELLGSELADRSRLVGLHFCCPVEPMKLVEVIQTEGNQIAVANAIQLVRGVRKTPVVVGDRPGFVVNRLLCPMLDEALVMLQEGVAIQTIDEALKDFGFAGGPFEMMDCIGLDTVLYTGTTLSRSFPDEVTAGPILAALIKHDRLGRKSGCGFYEYVDPDGAPECTESLAGIIGAYRIDRPGETSDGEVIDRLLIPMALQASDILAEGIVEDPREIDICSIFGTTFPNWKGGLAFWCHSNSKDEFDQRIATASKYRNLRDAKERIQNLLSRCEQVYS